MQNGENTEPAVKPYRSTMEYINGLRRVVWARRGLNEALFRNSDPSCSVVEAGEVLIEPDKERVEALEREHREALDEHNRRVECSVREGIVLPLDELAAQHELSAAERRLVEMLLVEMTDLTEDRDRYDPIRLATVARLAGDWDQAATQECFNLVLPGSKLVARKLVEVKARLHANQWTVALTRPVMEMLLGGRAQEETPAPAEPQPRCPAGNIAAALDEKGVVLEPGAVTALELLWAEVRFRERVMTEWGFAASGAPRAVAALFYGPSGTGKTMTARVIAEAQGSELIVVSYAEIFDKYVGETEKAIVGMFAEARRKSGVLLVDEADALVGQRGTIERAVDRHLNGEVNTFLMELERHNGVVILTTNHADLLDSALERRIRHKVMFATPGPELRSRIWRSRIPAAAPLAEDVDFTELGSQFELTGGQIANAALVAAFAAAARAESGGPAAISMADLQFAAAAERRGYGQRRAFALGFADCSKS